MVITVVVRLLKSDDNSKSKRSNRSSRSAGGSPVEKFKIIYRTKNFGELEEHDENMLWRITSSSYTVSTDEEEGYIRGSNETIIDDTDDVSSPQAVCSTSS